MQISSISVQGYRSLRDVSLRSFGSANVLYGANGTGKSNVLAAIRAALGLAGKRAATTGFDDARGGSWDDLATWLRPDDLCRSDPSKRMFLSVELRDVKLPASEIGFPSLSFAIEVDALGPGASVRFARLRGAGDLLCLFTHKPEQPPREQTLATVVASEGIDLPRGDIDGPRWIEEHVVRPLQRMLTELPRSFALVPGVRAPAPRSIAPPPGAVQSLGDALEWGLLADALADAQQSPDPAVRDGLDRLREVLAGPPLHRPRFDVVRTKGGHEIRERVGKSDLPLDLAGLGIVQVYTILAHVLLRGADAVAIEEPEAHLHAPSTGLQVRELLARVLSEGHVQQLFVATHSNLFDLDPSGYFDTWLVDGETKLERIDDLSRIDRDHLYEPGPAKHALQRSLRYLPEDEVLFRRAGGVPVTVTEMLLMLSSDDPAAVDFLRDVHAAAVRAVAIRSQKPEPR